MHLIAGKMAAFLFSASKSGRMEPQGLQQQSRFGTVTSRDLFTQQKLRDALLTLIRAGLEVFSAHAGVMPLSAGSTSSITAQAVRDKTQTLFPAGEEVLRQPLQGGVTRPGQRWRSWTMTLFGSLLCSVAVLGQSWMRGIRV